MSPVRFQGKEFVPAPSPTRWRLVVSLKLRHLFLLTFIAAYFMSWHNVTCCEFGDFFILTFFRTIKTITALHTYWSVTRCRVGKSGPLEESHGEEGPRSDSYNAAVNIYPWSWSFCRVRLISPGACWEKTSLRLQISGDQAAWRMRFCASCSTPAVSKQRLRVFHCSFLMLSSASVVTRWPRQWVWP